MLGNYKLLANLKRVMFDKILGKKQKTPQSIFSIPEKKYQSDPKKLHKYDKKQLLSEISAMEKYIDHLVEKLENGLVEYNKVIEKNDELSEKLGIVNSEISRINNEHEELGVKFENLTMSLEAVIKEKEEKLEKELVYLNDKGLIKEGTQMKDIQKIFMFYRGQISLMEKIQAQNKNLKDKYTSLEKDYYELTDKLVEQSSKQKRQISLLEEQSTQEGIQQNPSDIIIMQKQQTILSLTHQVSLEKHQNSKISLELDNITAQYQKLNQIFKQVSAEAEKYSVELKDLKLDNYALNNKNKQLQTKQTKLSNQVFEFREKAVLQSNKIEDLEKQLIETNTLYQHIKEERSMIQQQNNLRIQEFEEKITNLNHLLEERRISIENLEMKLQGYETELVSVSGQRQKIELALSQNKKLKQEVESCESKYKYLDESSQIKYKKLEFQMNQQKIRNQAMKRNLNLLEEKQKQNKTALDQLYEKKMHTDGRVGYLQAKLKEYKRIIQCLKKQKVQMEKTMEKIEGERNMRSEEVVVEEEDFQGQKNISSPNILELGMNLGQKQTEDFESEILGLKNKVINLEEEIMLSNEARQQLQRSIQQKNDQICGLEKVVRQLNENKEQITKQIKRLNSAKLPNPSQKTNKQKQKKAAQKAYKGFDILSKQLHQLYKEYLQVHLNDINKAEIKSIESQINQLVSKSMDMKDILQDYIE